MFLGWRRTPPGLKSVLSGRGGALKNLRPTPIAGDCKATTVVGFDWMRFEDLICGRYVGGVGFIFEGSIY